MTLLLISSLFLALSLLKQEAIAAPVYSVTEHPSLNEWIVKHVDGTVSFVPKNLKRRWEFSRPAPPEGPKVFMTWKDLSIGRSYRPTDVSGVISPSKLHASLNRSYLKESECYDRGHVWSYEMLKKYGVKSMKAFLFFSDEYIARTKYRWWFHTAPYVQQGNEIWVLDPKFARSPLRMRNWTNIFMPEKKACQETISYSDYSKHRGKHDCYVIKTSMYFWQPYDLEVFDQTGLQKLDFFEWEVRHAYEVAFGRAR